MLKVANFRLVSKKIDFFFGKMIFIVCEQKNRQKDFVNNIY